MVLMGLRTVCAQLFVSLHRMMTCRTINYWAPRFSLLAALSGAFWADGQELDIASLSLDELLEVEVTSPGKVPELIRDVPASVYLVSRGDIETYGYKDLTEVLENVPGFYNIDNYNGVGGSFGVRGFWNGRVKNGSMAILVNGVSQGRPDLLANPLENLSLPVEAIDRIEVTRGPNSVIYGNGASFGVINIITNGSFVDDQFSVSYGANDTRDFALRLSDFGEDHHLIVNAGLRETSGLDWSLLDMISEDRRDLLAGFGVAPGNETLDGRLEQASRYVQVSGAWKRLSLEYTHNDSDAEWFTGFPAVDDGSVRESESNRLTLKGDKPLTDELSLDVSLSFSDYDEEQFFDALYPGFEGYNSRSYQHWEVEPLLVYTPNESFRLIGGMNLRSLRNFTEFTHVPVLGLRNETIEIEPSDTQAIFSQASWNVNEKLRLVGGYRVERVKAFFRRGFLDVPIDGPPSFEKVQAEATNGTPRASVIYQPGEAQVFKFMIGDAVKQSNRRYGTKPMEQTRTTELNYTWSSESLLFSSSLFRNSLKDLKIEELTILPGNIVNFRPRTVGKAESVGLEVMLQSELTERLRGEVAVTYQDSDYALHPQGVMSYSPELVANAKVSYRLADWRISGLARYVGEMKSFYNTLESSSPLLEGGFFGQPSDSYLTFDLSVRLDDIFGNGFLSVNVENVFDTEIRYPNNPINGLLLDRGNLGPSRGVSVKAGFGF